MKHTLREHVSGRFQCTLCRAAFLTKESVRRSAEPCPEYERCHGHRYEREHVLYPFSYTRGDGHGPDRLCDEANCGVCVGHDCDCDVCGERLIAKDLCSVIENLDRKAHSLSPNWTEIDAMANLLELVNGFAVGASVDAIGVDTRGHSVKRTGVLLAEPKSVKAQRNGTPTSAVRVSVGMPGEEATARSTWVTIFADSGLVELVEVRDEWRNEPLGNVPGVRSGNHDIRIMFGGKGGKRSAEPSISTLAGVTYAGDGKYEVWVAESRDLLHTCALAGRVWWKPAPVEEEPGQAGETGSVQVLTTEPSGLEWKNTELRDTVSSAVIVYGGKGGKNSPGPSQARKVSLGYTRDGEYALCDLETRELVATHRLQSRIWWAAMPANHYENQAKPERQAAPELPDVREWARSNGYQVSDRGRVPAKVQVAFEMAHPGDGDKHSTTPTADILAPEPVKMVGRVPENTLYMAENANTAAARAWWQRRVESYSHGVKA
ncbi:Lsr2 family DNA-binding protein [Streptomyces sp. H39-S7]|uniref:Lsr2 family DNA-binding protein n=1 Tax=Streptomyces sp. H39-S7 TaxID=3004357 RepID=UPI0022AF4514|nr:histone-like nucleoid-structuring protein Lsr2 [Streptomyces sp. H39-S7]MCZ4119050.1 Lsr2 family protein [Streptomyces sp. H39-S7]